MLESELMICLDAINFCVIFALYFSLLVLHTFGRAMLRHLPVGGLKVKRETQTPRHHMSLCQISPLTADQGY